MKFEASHYDTVEWNPKPLEPGTAFYKPKKIAKVNIGIMGSATIFCF